jgi:N-acetylglucosaminyldiphosphoundecaprenol N-acetyl-beta-D-mannosaminyltransferase
MFEHVTILNTRIDCLNLDRLLSTALDWAKGDAPHTILYVNAHCMNIAATDKAYQKILHEASLVYSDGISIAWSSRLLGGCRLEKLTGADWIIDLCERCAGEGIGIYLLGGKPGVAQRATATLQNCIPGLRIAGYSDGYFHQKSPEIVLGEINTLLPQIVLVGMGSPLQEKWIQGHRAEITAPVCWAVGGLFEYLSGDLRRAPSWMSSLGLEWLWLLLIQPREKWRRYLVGNPRFILRVLHQWLSR